MGNRLFYGDNLDILRDQRYFPSESVDLIYLDPPFNSNRSYNVLFKDETGRHSAAQLQAFDDTWHWEGAAHTYEELINDAPPAVSRAMDALRSMIGTNQMMAYLVMMTARLIELHRILKPTGSLYLHCDPTASHYLKVVLDTIFDPRFFRNEIVWKRQSAHSDARTRFGDVTDTILFYARSDRSTWNTVFAPLDEQHVGSKYTYVEPDGRRFTTRDLRSPSYRANLHYVYKGYQPHPNGWSISKEKMEQYDSESRLYFPSSPDGRIRLKVYLDQHKGLPLQNLWNDIPPINSQARERLGYPTQKPLALLERIISASSNPGDIVLDPFAGCGTAIHAAQKLGRQWIGIDITHLSIALLKYRLKDAFGIEQGKDYIVVGEPEDLGGARQLAQDDRYQFQWWALSLVKAKPLGASGDSKQGKKGADKGIDGVIQFAEHGAKAQGQQRREVLIQVKSGKVNSSTIRDLVGTVDREKAAIGVLITLEEASRPMREEAASAGYYQSVMGSFPKIQILTIAQLLDRATIQMPREAGTFKQADRERLADPDEPTQLDLL